MENKNKNLSPPRPFRIWHVPQVDGMSAFYVFCKTLKEACVVEAALAPYDNFAKHHGFINSFEESFSAMSGLEVWNNELGAWIEWSYSG